MSEHVFYRYNTDETIVKVNKLYSKKTNGMNIRRKLKPFGDAAGQCSTEIGEEVNMEWINNEEYLDEYGPGVKTVVPKNEIIDWDEYGPNEEQLLREIRLENKKSEVKPVKEKTKKRERKLAWKSKKKKTQERSLFFRKL